MRAKLQMWGNSLALRLPKHLAQAKEFHSDDEVELVPEDDGIKIIKANRPETLADLLAASPADGFELSSEDKEWLNVDPVGREIIG